MTDKTISFRVPDGLEKHLLKLAEKKGCSVGASVRVALDSYFSGQNDTDNFSNMKNQLSGIQKSTEYLDSKLEKLEVAITGIAAGLNQIYGAKK
jgi:predicted DNA-binding protein